MEKYITKAQISILKKKVLSFSLKDNLGDAQGRAEQTAEVNMGQFDGKPCQGAAVPHGVITACLVALSGPGSP